MLLAFRLNAAIPIGRACFSTGCTLQMIGNKHWDPKFRKLRGMKVIRFELPSYDPESRQTTEEIRAKMKEKGIVPPRPWQEKPVFISSTSGIFEPYLPPEGDGKISPVKLAKQTLLRAGKTGSYMLAVRKIKAYEDNFDADRFADDAQEIYVKMHRALADKAEDLLHELVTENAYPAVTSNMGKNRIVWNFIKSVEPPRVVHAKVTNVIADDNMFGQLTVRFHTQQTLAVYDRFGRLMHGSEVVVKDVLEYVVFEKHLSNVYGIWRVHDKIIPDWMPPKEATFRTFLKKEAKVEEEDVEAPEETTSKKAESQI